MRSPRAHCLILVAAMIVAAGACDTGAHGVEDCRTIEVERCQAAVHCDVGLAPDELDICTHFSQDNCLHGFRVEDPGKNAVDRCVSAIQTAGECAADDPEQDADDCETDLALAPGTTVCEIVIQPEYATECAFLVPDNDDNGNKDKPPPDEPDAGPSEDGG